MLAASDAMRRKYDGDDEWDDLVVGRDGGDDGSQLGD